MRLFEIVRQSRKHIKRLQNMYISYALDRSLYGELMDFLSIQSNTTDIDMLREIDIIKSKLHDDVIKSLTSELPDD